MTIFLVLELSKNKPHALGFVQHIFSLVFARIPCEELVLIDAGDGLETTESACTTWKLAHTTDTAQKRIDVLTKKLGSNFLLPAVPQKRWEIFQAVDNAVRGQPASAYSNQRVLLITDDEREFHQPEFCRPGKAPLAVLHVALILDELDSHCPFLEDLSAASQGSYTRVFLESSPPSKRKRPAGAEGEAHAGRQSGREAPEPVASSEAAERLAGMLSSVQDAELFLGHLSAKIGIRPPLRPRDGRAEPAVSVLGFVPAGLLVHPLAVSSHAVVQPPGGGAEPLLVLLRESMKGESTGHEALTASVAVKGSRGEDSPGILQLEASPEGGGDALRLSLLHPSAASHDWLERRSCKQAVGPFLADIGERLKHRLSKLERYAQNLPQRKKALQESIADIKGLASSYASPELLAVASKTIASVLSATRTTVAAEQSRVQQHNTRNQSATATGASQALPVLEEALAELGGQSQEGGAAG